MPSDLTIIIDSMVRVPFGLITRADAPYLRARLEVMPRDFGDGEERKAVNLLDIDERNGRAGLPLAEGLAFTKIVDEGCWYDDRRSFGIELRAAALPDFNHPKSPKGQKEFATRLQNRVKGFSGYAFGVSPTGTGKTVSSLYVAATLGRSTLVIVPSRSLAEQWTNEAKKHIRVHPRDIGMIGDGERDWKGKRFVIAIVNSAIDIEGMEPEFYNHFGTVIWDEVHRYGARTFSRSLVMFNARYRIAVTATADRKDGCAELYHRAFGDPATFIVATSDALPGTFEVVEWKQFYKIHPGTPKQERAQYISAVARDKKRNSAIASRVADAFHRGRNILVLSDRIDQLKALRELAGQWGMTNAFMFTGKQSSAALEKAKKEARVFFATYGMMKEGVDIPRLDWGIEATPRVDATQGPGRVRRIEEGKYHPHWIIFNDVLVPPFSMSVPKRIAELKSTGMKQLS